MTVRIGETLLALTLSTAAAARAEVSPPSFQNDVLPILAKQGCSSASCHGSPSGKGGFRLSVWGVDPDVDHVTMTHEILDRRVDLQHPESSLILVKPSGRVPHGGGVRLARDSAEYLVLLEWLRAGARHRPDPRCVDLTIRGGEPVIDLASNGPEDASLELRAQADFEDGTSRDVTSLAVFSSTDERVATVSTDGHVRATGRGQVAINVRYLDQIETLHVTVVDDVEGFAWEAPTPVNYIDEIVYADLRQLRILPSNRASDEAFLRRVYLDVVGVLPTVAETRAFLDDDSCDKRARLIERLLERPEHASFWAQRWGDYLKLTQDRMGRVAAAGYAAWLEKSFADNVGYDRFVRDLLTATGGARKNPCVSYFAIGDDHYEVMEATARVFLGAQVECARCHNHPFERWTQRNYHGLRHFFYRVERQGDDAVPTYALAPAGSVQLPGTDRDVRPWLPGSPEVELDPEGDPREVFVDWLTAPGNPYFARTEVNRIWAFLFGRGLVDPIDDFRETNPPVHPDLLDALAADFVAHEFDRRHIVRTILKSNVYQASVRPNAFNRDDERHFSRLRPRRLTAEQLLDAICHVTGVPERFEGLADTAHATALTVPDVTEHPFLRKFGQPERANACACERPRESNLGEALELLNGRLVQGKLRDSGNRIHRGIREKRTDEDIVEELYLAAFCRRPRPAEIAAARRYLAAKKDRGAALEDLCWAILGTEEFLSQH